MPLFDAAALFDLSHYQHSNLFMECNQVWDALAKLELYLRQHLKTQPPCHPSRYPGAVIVNPGEVILGEGTTVEAGAYIEGPCVIGDHCTIRHGAYVRENVLAGNYCVIGHGTELKNVILLDHVHIAHLSYCGDSIFGNHCNLGAGVKCANLRFDGKSIEIHSNGEKYPTGRRKLGAIAGDHVQLGCNSVTNPGTILGKNSFLFPCTNFGGVTPAESIIHQEAKAIVSLKTVKK